MGHHGPTYLFLLPQMSLSPPPPVSGRGTASPRPSSLSLALSPSSWRPSLLPFPLRTPPPQAHPPASAFATPPLPPLPSAARAESRGWGRGGGGEIHGQYGSRGGGGGGTHPHSRSSRRPNLPSPDTAGRFDVAAAAPMFLVGDVLGVGASLRSASAGGGVRWGKGQDCGCAGWTGRRGGRRQR